MAPSLVHWLLTLSLQTPTYHRDVRPILEQKCNTCHRADGLAGFGFSSYEHSRDMHGAIADSVRSGRMPPWPPDENCRALQRSRALSATERDVLLAWSAAGAPEGDGLDSAPPATDTRAAPAHQEPILRLQALAAYVPDAREADDYRCFVLPQSFDENTYITGYDFRPGQNQLVHHAALFLALPAWFEQLNALESASAAQPGYPCFGGPGIDYVEYLGGWVPGSGVVLFPEDSAFVVPAGAKLMMQVHDNLSAGFTAPDKTQVSLSVVEQAPLLRLKQRPSVQATTNAEAARPVEGAPEAARVSRWYAKQTQRTAAARAFRQIRLWVSLGSHLGSSPRSCGFLAQKIVPQRGKQTPEASALLFVPLAKIAANCAPACGHSRTERGDYVRSIPHRKMRT